MESRSLKPVQVTLPLVGKGAPASIPLPDYRLNEKLAGVEQRIRELESLLSAASRERLRLMARIADVRQKLLEMEATKAVLGGYQLREVAPGWHVYTSIKELSAGDESFACPEWHHAEKVTLLEVVNSGRRQTIYRCTSPACRFLRTVDSDF